MRSVCGTHLAAKASTPDLACLVDHPKSRRLQRRAASNQDHLGQRLQQLTYRRVR
jgi:hypothetical protein